MCLFTYMQQHMLSTYMQLQLAETYVCGQHWGGAGGGMCLAVTDSSAQQFATCSVQSVNLCNLQIALHNLLVTQMTERQLICRLARDLHIVQLSTTQPTDSASIHVRRCYAICRQLGNYLCDLQVTQGTLCDLLQVHDSITLVQVVCCIYLVWQGISYLLKPTRPPWLSRWRKLAANMICVGKGQATTNLELFAVKKISRLSTNAKKFYTNYFHHVK